MAQVLFKKGPSQSFDTDKDLNSIIFKKSTNPQAPGFSEIYLGDNRCGVGHNFSIGSDGLVPAPTMADIGKVLTPNGWIDVSKISGSDNVKQVGIESSTTLYPILLKGTTGASDYTGQVNFTSTVNQNIPLLSASPNGHLNCKSLGVVEGDASFLLGDINLMDIPLTSGGHSLNLVSSVNSSTESSPSILLARSESLGTTTDRYTNWRIQNAANGVLTFTPEKTGTSETPFVSVLSNVTAISFTVSGVSSSDTYIKADGSGYGGVFTGAGEAAGTAGLVPAPAIGDAGKYLKGDGTWGEIQSGSDLSTPVTYSELVTLKTGGNLVPGTQYRITDYTCTTTQANTQSASHVFDIIVTADSETELNENARAAHHTGDTYFTNCDLDAWELKYCLENDTNRFTWADTTNGKGVIYYMKDEWNNECPYDFKNIKFQRWEITELSSCPALVANSGSRNEYNFYFGAKNISGTNTVSGATYGSNSGYFYTFALKDLASGNWFDYTVVANIGLNTYFGTKATCYENHISHCVNNQGPNMLSNNVFFNVYSNISNPNNAVAFSVCNNNNFLGNCVDNTFGNNCARNSFESDCYSNVAGNNFYINTFGVNCTSSKFGYGCYGNSIGNNCGSNTFGSDCVRNSFGNSCSNVSFGDNCSYMYLHDACYNITFGHSCQAVTVFSSVGYCDIPNYARHAEILSGTNGTSSNRLAINFVANKNYTQVAGLVNGTDLRIWIAEDTVTGPSTTTNNHIAVFDGTTGKIIKDSGVTVGDLQVDVPEYTIEKLNQAETGYASSYVLKKDDVQVGSTINIPKDMVVSSGEVKTVTTANVPYQGAQVGDKYIDLTIANSSSQHIYIPVKDLVDVYQAGNGISIDASNYISVKIDSANANGLATTTSGLKLDTVTTTTNGAMTATDKVKLDSINGNYWGSQTLSAAASYITTPEFQHVTINGDPTATQASTDHCVMVYDTTNKCLKFTF